MMKLLFKWYNTDKIKRAKGYHKTNRRAKF